jgi:hypothetical protein
MKEPDFIFDFDPRNAPADVLQAIGLVAMAAAQTESVMQHLIGSLLGIDNIQTLALTAHMAAPLKDHVSRELDAPNLTELDKLDTLLDNVETAFAKRNAVVHNSLAMHPNGTVLSLRETARGSLQVKLTPLSVSELREDAAFIYEAGMALQRFMIARGLSPVERTRPVRAPPNRKQKARESRRTLGVGDRKR